MVVQQKCLSIFKIQRQVQADRRVQQENLSACMSFQALDFKSEVC